MGAVRVAKFAAPLLPQLEEVAMTATSLPHLPHTMVMTKTADHLEPPERHVKGDVYE
jgi:hypothetical protein